MMDLLLYWLALALLKFLEALPLRGVARLGRACGGLAYWLDARHRRVAIENLTRCFSGEKSALEIRELARENFKRLGESYGCGIKTATMTWTELEPHLEFGGLEKLRVGEERGERQERRSVEASELPTTLRRSDAPTLPPSHAPTLPRSHGRIMAIGHF